MVMMGLSPSSPVRPQASGLREWPYEITYQWPSYSHPSNLVAATHNDGASSDSYLIASQSVGSSASLRLLFVGSGCHLLCTTINVSSVVHFRYDADPMTRTASTGDKLFPYYYSTCICSHPTSTAPLLRVTTTVPPQGRVEETSTRWLCVSC
jgi:hypothetical protein